MSKLTGDVDRDKLLELAPGELHQLDGWSGPADGTRGTSVGSTRVQIAGTYVKDGSNGVIGQKTVIIPGRTGPRTFCSSMPMPTLPEQGNSRCGDRAGGQEDEDHRDGDILRSPIAPIAMSARVLTYVSRTYGSRTYVSRGNRPTSHRARAVRPRRPACRRRSARPRRSMARPTRYLTEFGCSKALRRWPCNCPRAEEHPQRCPHPCVGFGVRGQRTEYSPAQSWAACRSVPTRAVSIIPGSAASTTEWSPATRRRAIASRCDRRNPDRPDWTVPNVNRGPSARGSDAPRPPGCAAPSRSR